MDFNISPRGLKVSVDSFKKTFGSMSKDVLSKYTLTYTPKIGPIRTCVLYKIIMENNKHYFLFPRMTITSYIQSRLVKSIKSDFPYNPIRIELKSNVRLYDYQEVVVRKLLDDIYNPLRAEKGLAAALLDLRPGAGKTFIAAYLCVMLGVRTLYIAPLKHLALQARDDFTTMLNLSAGNIRIGFNDLNADINFVVINTAMTLTDTQLSKYSFIIYDEIHTYCSEQRRVIFWKAQAKYTLGMSGTTSHREDGFDKIYYKHLGAPIYAAKLPGFTFNDLKFDLRVKFIKYYGSAEYTKNLRHAGKVSVHLMYDQFMRDEVRMCIICDEINRLYADPRRNIYVFAEECENLRNIIDYYKKYMKDNPLPDIAMYDSDSIIGYFVGGTPASDITRIKDNARIVFTTYRLCSTGTSWLKMNAMILATPRKACIEQLAGRIMRKGSDISIPRDIIDIVDMKTCLSRQMQKRKHSYKVYAPKINKVIYKATSHCKFERSARKGANRGKKTVSRGLVEVNNVHNNEFEIV
jgi:superfamily II DNA or RNA helicase